MYSSDNKHLMIWKMLSVIVIPVYVKHLDIDNEIFIVSWINVYANLISYFIQRVDKYFGENSGFKDTNYKNITMTVF